MWINFVNWFTKITAWPLQWVCFRTKVYYQDRAAQGRRIRGGAVLVSNHTSVFDYAVYLFVFFSRTLRVQMAEVLFRKPVLGTYLKWMGGIYVDRDTHDPGCIVASQQVLYRGGVVGVFPEGRLPRPGETPPLEYKTGAAYLALTCGVPLIPVYTDGSYFRRRRARVMIGMPLYAADLIRDGMSEKERLACVTDAVRERISELGRLLNEQSK